MHRLLVGVAALVLGGAVLVVAPEAGTSTCIASPAGVTMCETPVQVTADVLTIALLGLFAIAAGSRIVWTEFRS